MHHLGKIIMQRPGVGDLLPTHSSGVLINKTGYEVVGLEHIAGMFLEDLRGYLDRLFGLVQYRGAVPPCDRRIHQGWNQDGAQNQAGEPQSFWQGRLYWRPLPRLTPDSQVIPSPRYRMALAGDCHTDLFPRDDLDQCTATEKSLEGGLR